MTAQPREWDAGAYDELASPQSRWGLRVLDLLELQGNETVLEAGCGTGRDTERLLQRLPAGRVIALDGSARMLDRLTARLAGRLDRVEVVNADLGRPLKLSRQVDVVFSVAAFHWVQDHDVLFPKPRCCHGAGRPLGGRLRRTRKSGFGFRRDPGSVGRAGGRWNLELRPPGGNSAKA